MLHMEFALLSGLYNTDFTDTPQYKQLFIDFPLAVSAKEVQLHLSHRRSHELGLMKASFFTCLARRYVHAIFACSFAGRADN